MNVFMVAAIAFFAVYIGFFCIVLDADFVTYFYDLYRQQFVSDCFDGKTVWIIGASSGIGECSTYNMIENGASKVIISSRREDELKRVQSNAQQMHKKYKNLEIYIKTLDLLDFLDEDYTKSFIKEFYTIHPDIDIVVFNAGITQSSKALETSLKTTKMIFDVNVFSIISAVKSIINHGFESNNNTDKETQIVITSSLSAVVGEPYSSSYAASKSALNGYFQSIQLELIRYNIYFTMIYPGPIELDSKSIPSVDANGDSVSRRSLYNKFDSKEVMLCSRCAQLFCSAIHSKVRYSWISNQPILGFSYLAQYASFIIKYIQEVVAPNYL